MSRVRLGRAAHGVAADLADLLGSEHAYCARWVGDSERIFSEKLRATFFGAMSARKRSDQGSVTRAPKRPVHESGVMYLYQQLRELDTDKSPFIVEADDSDVTSWTVGISSGALREHLDLPRLARELDQWQRASQQQPVIVKSVRLCG